MNIFSVIGTKTAQFIAVFTLVSMVIGAFPIFVAAEESISCAVIVASNSDGDVPTEGGVPTFEHSTWTQDIIGAQWLWSDALVVNPLVDQTETFTQSFVWGGDSISNIDFQFAADNGYVVKLNGVEIASAVATLEPATDYHSAVRQLTVNPGDVVIGENELTFEITNIALPDSTSESNPAGFVFKMIIDGEGASCDTVPVVPPVDLCNNVAGIQALVPEGYSVDGSACYPTKDGETPGVINTCLSPNTLGDDSAFIISDSGEETVAEMLAANGYAAINTTTDQINYQVWNLTDPSADSVTFSMRVLGKVAENTQIVGYYKAGDVLSFTPELTKVANVTGFSSESSVSVTIPAAYAASFGFALKSADKTWFSETSLNTDGEDHVAVYNPSNNTYLLAFEDTDTLGDNDFNDLVIEVDNVSCNTDTDGGNDDTVITGCKFNDLDGNGAWDKVTEPTIPGWEIMLEQGDAEPQYATTGANGCYSFKVEPGSYQVSETGQKGWEQTATIGNGADGDRCYITVADDEITDQRALVTIGSSYACDFGNKEVVTNQCTFTDNLLANGSFEAPIIAAEDGGWNVFDSVVNGLAWAVSWITEDENAPVVAKLELQDGIYDASEGNQYAELDSNWRYSPGGEVEGDARVKIEQTIPTVIGQNYTLALDFSAIPGINGGSLNNSVGVYINGLLVDTQSADGTANTNTDWNTFTYNFVASSSSTTIALADAGVADTFGTFVDKVSLVGCEPDNGGDVGDGGNGGNGGSSGSRVKRTPTGEVLGASTSTPAGLVLGEATSTLPVGAPNTGAGGTSPVSVQLPISFAILPKTQKIK